MALTKIILTSLLIIIAFVAVVVTAVKMASKREKEIYSNGIEVNSVVSRNEHYFVDHHSRYRCYVSYQGDDGSTHEGLLNLRSNLPVGRKVQIKYIPGKYDEVLFVSQEIE